MAEIRWHPKAEQVLLAMDDRQAARIERAVDRLARFPLSGTALPSLHPGLRRVLSGGGRTAWSVFYLYDEKSNAVSVLALGPPGMPVFSAD